MTEKKACSIGKSSMMNPLILGLKYLMNTIALNTETKLTTPRLNTCLTGRMVRL